MPDVSDRDLQPLPGCRISIRGCSSSGKSTLGAALGEILGLEYTELDALHHMEGWTERPVEDFRRLVAERVAGARWIVDGNYAKVRDLVFDGADTVIWLDYALPVILIRLTRRTWRRCLTRELLWGVNRESLWRHFFTKDSLYLWVLTTYKRRRQQAEELFSSKDHTDKILIRFRVPSETDRWLEQVRTVHRSDRLGQQTPADTRQC